LEDGAAQFRKDVAVNPNDTEEAIWAFLCEAKTLGFDKARARILRVGKDPRGYMREAYALFDGTGSEAGAGTFLTIISQVDNMPIVPETT
jgi:hypothetical protein